MKKSSMTSRRNFNEINGFRTLPSIEPTIVLARQGVVDMTGISGYYTFLAMQLNMAHYEFAGEDPRLSRFPN
jgi:hypothetical protein